MWVSPCHANDTPKWPTLVARSMLLLGGLDVGARGITQLAFKQDIDLFDGIGNLVPSASKLITASLRLLLGASALFLFYTQLIVGLPTGKDCQDQRIFGIVFMSVVSLVVVVGVYGAWRG